MRMRQFGIYALMVLMVWGVGNSIAKESATVKKLNPYLGDPATAKEGRRLYFYNGCNGCHGGTGGGGMAGAPPLIDDEWNYGSDDGTLFKLITGQIPQQIMPKVFSDLKEEEVWTLITYIRSIYKGDPGKINW